MIMECRQVQPIIADFSVGLLRAREQEQVEQHLAACAACACDLRQLEAVMGAVEQFAAKEPPPHLWNGVYNRITSEAVQERPGLWDWLLHGPRRLVAGTATGLAAAALVAAFYFNSVQPPPTIWADDQVAGSTAAAVQRHAMLAGNDPFADEVGLEAYAQLVTRANATARTETH
jgi:anti-sigma factor RsiW